MAFTMSLGIKPLTNLEIPYKYLTSEFVFSLYRCIAFFMSCLFENRIYCLIKWSSYIMLCLCHLFGHSFFNLSQYCKKLMHITFFMHSYWIWVDFCLFAWYWIFMTHLSFWLSLDLCVRGYLPLNVSVCVWKFVFRN